MTAALAIILTLTLATWLGAIVLQSAVVTVAVLFGAAAMLGRIGAAAV